MSARLTQKGRRRIRARCGRGGGRPIDELDGLGWEHFIEAALRRVRRAGYRDSTIDTYRGMLNRLARHIGGSPWAIKEVELRSYLHFLRIRKRVSPAWIAQHISLIRLVWARLQSRPLALTWAMPRRGRRLPIQLDREDIRRCMAVCENWSERIIMQLALGSGLKAGEMRALRWRDILLEDNCIQVPDNSGSGIRAVPMPEVIQAHARQQQLVAPERYVICGRRNNRPMSARGFSAVLHRLNRRMGCNGLITSGRLRQHFAQTLLDCGTKPTALRNILGLQTLPRFTTIQ